MSHYDTIFLDRDGTLNSDSGYISTLEQFKLYDFTIPALDLLAKRGNRFCIITNQSGVGRDIIKMEDLNQIHEYLKRIFSEHKIPLLNIYFCTDHPDNASKRRKPEPGMFLEAASDYNLNLKRCLMVGDAISDIEAGMKLDMDTMLVLTGRGTETKKNSPDNIKPTYITENLLTGAHLLMNVGKS